MDCRFKRFVGYIIYTLFILLIVYIIIIVLITGVVRTMHLTLEQQLNQPGVNVWDGNSNSGVFRPIYFDGTVTSKISRKSNELSCSTVATTVTWPLFPNIWGPCTLFKSCPKVSWWNISWEMDWPKRFNWLVSTFTWLNPSGFFWGGRTQGQSL